MKTPKTSKSEKPTNSTERLSKLIKKLKRLEQRVKYYQEQWPYGEIDHRGLNTGADNYWSEEVQPFVEAIELDLDELWDCIVSFTRPEDNFGGYYPPTGTLAQNLSHNIKYVLRSRKLSCVHTLIQHLKKIQRRIVIQTGQAEPAEPKPTEGGGGETNLPDYRAVNLAERTITIGAKTYPVTSERVWDFLKDLCSAFRQDRIVPLIEGNVNNKNAVDQLRKLIGKDNLHNFVMSVKGGYKLNPDVKILEGGQIGIRKTHLSHTLK